MHTIAIVARIKQNSAKAIRSMAVPARIHSNCVVFFVGEIIFCRSPSSEILDVELVVDSSVSLLRNSCPGIGRRDSIWEKWLSIINEQFINNYNISQNVQYFNRKKLQTLLYVWFWKLQILLYYDRKLRLLQ